jgi:predicted nucleotidyltransferase
MKYPLYQDSLCPKLWVNGKLDAEVQKGLLDIAVDFVNDLRDDHDLPVEILDVVIIGSVANYNWTPYSDIDLHIITDFSKFDMPAEQAQIMFDALKGNWNNKHNITVKGHDIELYVQDKDYEPSSAAEYSILKAKWLKEPKKESPQFDKALIKKKFIEYKKKIDALTKNADEDGLRKLLDKLYKYRQAGLDKGGELSDENIIFKALRAKGYLDKIKDTVTKLYDKKMTVDETS